MRAIKKCAVMMLAILALIQIASTVFANYEEEREILIAEVYAASPGLQSAAATFTGVIQEIIANENVYNILVSVVDNDNDEVILKVFDDTAIIDNATKQRMRITELKEGELIVAFVSNAMTMSLPPQVNAHAIIANVRRDAPVARYMTIAEVQETGEGRVRVLSEDGAYLVTISGETKILPYKENQVVGNENILVGKRMFAWFEVMALSVPAQAEAEYVVILPAVDETGIITTQNTEHSAQNEEVATQSEEFTAQPKENGRKLSYENFDRIGVHGNIIALYETPLFVKNEEIMIPIRKVSYALGFSVEWDAERKEVSIHTVNGTFSMRIGYDEYIRDGYYTERTERSIENLGIAPMLVGGVTYVPAALLDFIFEDNEATDVVEGMFVVKAGVR